jgi:hypothetical protein
VGYDYRGIMELNFYEKGAGFFYIFIVIINEGRRGLRLVLKKR